MGKFIEFSNDRSRYIINLENYSVRKYYLESSMGTIYYITFTKDTGVNDSITIRYSDRDEWNKFYERISSVIWQN